MHTPLRSLRRHVATAATLIGLTSATALAQTWTGGGDGISWNDPLNWNLLPPNLPNSGIAFNNGAALTTTQNLANPLVLGNLFQGTAANLTINGNPLNFQAAGQSQINLGAVVSVINAPVIMSSPLATFAADLTLAGGLSGPGELRLGSGSLTLTGPGTWTGGTALGNFGNTTLRVAAPNALVGNVSFSFSGSNSLVDFVSPTPVTFAGDFTNSFFAASVVRQSGPGVLLLTGTTSSFLGKMEIASGATLRSGNVNALTPGTVDVQNGGTLEMALNNSLKGEISIASTGTLEAAGFQQTTPVRIDNGGTVNLPIGSDVTVGPNSTWTGISTGAGSLSFNGFNINLNAGTNLLHTGGTTQTGGQLNINVPNVLPDSGLLRVSGGSLIHSTTETVDTVLVDGGFLNAAAMIANGAVDLQSGGISGASLTINGAFTKTTAGTAQIGGVTLAGGGTVSAGVLNVNGVVAGALLNNATVDLPFPGSAVNGPVTNTGTFAIGSGSALNGTTTNTGTITLNGGTLAGTVAHSGTIASNGGAISADVSGTGDFTANAANTSLTGVNTYSGGSTTVNSITSGTTDSIQGVWTLTNSGLIFNQTVAGTMSGKITGAGGSVSLQGTGLVTLSGNNSFTGGVLIYPGAQFGIGSNTAAGSGGAIQGIATYKLSAEGGARTVANPLTLVGTNQTEFTGSNNLTFTNTAPKVIDGGSVILHTSTATTTVAGTFLGQNTTTINVSAGTLVLGAAVNNGFRMDGTINVASGATLQMISNSPVKLGPTSLAGGTLIAPSGVAVPTGLALTAAGVIQGRVSSEAGSLIEATGALTIGDAASFGGFLSNGELRTQQFTVNIFDKNQAVLGSLTEVGGGGLPGNLTAANGVFVDFGRALTGWGTVAGTNTLASATIINGDAAGLSALQPLDFTGYVKGIGSFADVTFSGTFSPGLSPAISPVNNVNFGPLAVIVMEIGGLTPGSQHDQFDITGTLGLNGTLDIDLINGFNPSLGDTFNLFDGTTSGAFTAFSFPALGSGLAWDISDLYSSGDLKVVPEPNAALLLLAGLAAIMRRRR